MMIMSIIVYIIVVIILLFFGKFLWNQVLSKKNNSTLDLLESIWQLVRSLDSYSTFILLLNYFPFTLTRWSSNCSWGSLAGWGCFTCAGSFFEHLEELLLPYLQALTLFHQ